MYTLGRVLKLAISVWLAQLAMHADSIDSFRRATPAESAYQRPNSCFSPWEMWNHFWLADAYPLALVCVSVIVRVRRYLIGASLDKAGQKALLLIGVAPYLSKRGSVEFDSTTWPHDLLFSPVFGPWIMCFLAADSKSIRRMNRDGEHLIHFVKSVVIFCTGVIYFVHKVHHGLSWSEQTEFSWKDINL